MLIKGAYKLKVYLALPNLLLAMVLATLRLLNQSRA